MIRLMIAEDVSILRHALVALLRMQPDFEVAAEVEAGDLIVPTALKHRPDVALLDIALPGLDGLTAAELLHKELPECKVVILASVGRPADLHRALAAKVSGFVLKDSSPDVLATTIRDVVSGQRVINSSLLLSALDVGDSPLTMREADVLRMTSQGAEAAEIAERLFLSVGTVRNYLTVIVSKLGARNRIDAIRIAREAGWV